MKRIIGLYFLIVGIGFSAYAQVDSIALHYASEIKISSAKKHLNILASDEFEGRDTGKPGGEKAAQYIADEFKKIGLLPSLNGSYFQEVPLAEPFFGVKEFIVNNQHLEVGKDFFISGS